MLAAGALIPVPAAVAAAGLNLVPFKQQNETPLARSLTVSGSFSNTSRASSLLQNSSTHSRSRWPCLVSSKIWLALRCLCRRNWEASSRARCSSTAGAASWGGGGLKEAINKTGSPPSPRNKERAADQSVGEDNGTGACAPPRQSHPLAVQDSKYTYLAPYPESGGTVRTPAQSRPGLRISMDTPTHPRCLKDATAPRPEWRHNKSPHRATNNDIPTPLSPGGRARARSRTMLSGGARLTPPPSFGQMVKSAPKSPAAAEGLTKSDEGERQRKQLVFCTLATREAVPSRGLREWPDPLLLG